jgi:hypothetical protein
MLQTCKVSPSRPSLTNCGDRRTEVLETASRPEYLSQPPVPLSQADELSTHFPRSERSSQAAQATEQSIALLLDATARIQLLSAYPYDVVVYFGPGQDIALGEAGDGSVTAELGLVER